MPIAFYIRLASVFFCLALPLRGQYASFFTDLEGTNAGHTVVNFLTLPVGANQLGRGLACAMPSWDATDALMATGNTAFFNQYQFAVSHLEWLMGLRKEYVAGCMPILDVGTAGVFSQVFTLGSFEDARDIDEYASNPQALEVNAGASFARMLVPDKLGVGMTASYIESHLAGDIGRALNVGLDATFRPVPKFTAHTYVHNAGTRLVYNETPEPQPLQAGLAAEYSPWLADDTLNRHAFGLNTAFGVLKTADLPLQAGVGVEVSPIKVLALRAGYEYNYGQALSPAGLSGGVSISFKGYGADAALKYQSPEFGWVWSATVKFATEEITQRTALDYYHIAEKHFRKNRNFLCIQFAKRALLLNPNMWQAHELIAQCVARMRRQRGTEIALIYTGNVKGQLVPLAVNGATIGGLARQAAVIRSLRQQFKFSITLDAGNMIGGSSAAIKAQFADDYFAALKFDAVGTGDGELDFGLGAYLDIMKKSRPSLVTTNARRPTPIPVTDVRIVTAGKYQIAVLDAVGINAPKTGGGRASLTHPLSLLAKQLASKKVGRCNVRVLLLNDSWDKCRELVAGLNGVDVVICGSLGQKFAAPMKVGNAIFLSPGEYGKYVGLLVLRFGDKGQLLSSDNRLVPLTDEITPDPEIAKLLKKVTEKTEGHDEALVESEIAEAPVDGVFPFVSDRHGAPSIYLKIPLRNLEFPLTAGKRHIGLAALSFAAQKIAYLEGNDSTGLTALRIMDLAGAGKRTLAVSGSASQACFTPDGRWVYAVVAAKSSDTTTSICRIRTEGGEPQPVITWPGAKESDITFSSNGLNMAFASNRDGKWQIFLTDTAAATPVRLTDPNADHVAPAFSPDGMYIAFLSDRETFGGRKDLWLHEVATGKQIRLTMDKPVREFAWLPDNKAIAYTWGGKDTVRLSVCDIVSKASSRLLQPDSSGACTVSRPRVVRFKGATKIVYTRQCPGGDTKIFWINPDGSENRVIVDSEGKDWLE